LENKSQGLTRAERLFLMYNYIIRHCGRKRIATKQDIIKHLELHGVETLHETPFILTFVFEDGVYDFELEYNDTSPSPLIKTNMSAEVNILKIPFFEPHELRLMINSVQQRAVIRRGPPRKGLRRTAETVLWLIKYRVIQA